MKSAILAFVGVALMTVQAQLVAQPGAIELSLNATSINNVMQTFVPILAYYALNNQTFNVNETIKGTGYKLVLNDVHIVEATGFTTKLFKNIEGTDKVHVTIGGVDISMDVDGELDALYFIPLKASHVNVTNTTIDFVLEPTSDDTVHWGIAENTTLTLGGVKISTGSKVLDELVKLSSGVINKIIQGLLPKVSAAVDTEVAALNAMLANEGPYTFDVSLLGANFPLNLTLTSAPSVSKDLIQVNFDGLFHDAQNATTHQDFPIDKNAQWPDRQVHSLSEQVFIHESMLDSLMSVAQGSFFPYVERDANVSQALLAAFPTIANRFGSDANVSLSINLMPNATAAPVNFNATRGIVIGDLDDVKSVVKILVSNENVTDRELATLQMNFEMAGNMTMKDLVFYPSVQEMNIENTYVKRDHIGLEGDFNKIFETIAKDYFNAFNTKWVKGWSITNIDPALGMLTGLLKDTTLTPYVQDNWMYGGFSMQADLPTLEEEVVIIQ